MLNALRRQFRLQLRTEGAGRAIALGGLAAVFALILFAGFWTAQRKCVADVSATSLRLSMLNAEIDARRSALVSALQSAKTAADIRNAAQYLGSNPSRNIKATPGMTFGDLKYERGLLREHIIVDDPEGLRSKAQVSPAFDPWVIQNYPVDQFGYLLGASTNDLPTLRLAAREELAIFHGSLIISPHSNLEAVPNCSVIHTLGYLFLGTRHLLLRQKP